MQGLERRRKERIRCILGVGKINGQTCPHTFLTDISSIGAQLETDFSLTIGDPVEFYLSPATETPAAKEAYLIAGQVVWIKESELDLQRFRIGLLFSTPISEATEILAQFRYRLV